MDSFKVSKLISRWNAALATKDDASPDDKWLRLFNDPTKAGDALGILALLHMSQFTGDARVLLLEELVARVDDAAVLSPELKPGVVPKRHLSIIACSLYYCSLFCTSTREPSVLLEKVMARWKPFVATLQNTGLTGLMNRTLTLLEYGVTGDLITMYLKEAIDALTSTQPPPGPKEWCICGLMFTRLRQLIMNHDPLSKDIARVLLQVLRQQQHRSNESTALVLHILFMYITLSSSTEKKFCLEAIATIKPFLIYPEPLGSLSMRLLQKLNVDAVIPGTSWRERAEMYLPWLTSEDVVSEALSPKAYVFLSDDDVINAQLGVPLDHDPLSHRVARSVLRQLLACHLAVSPEAIPLGSVTETQARLHYTQLRSELLDIQRGTNSRTCKRVASSHLKKLAAANDEGDGRHHHSSRIVFDFIPHVVDFDCKLSGATAGTKFPRRNAYHQMSSLLLQCVDDGVRALRLMLSGTDADFHHFLTAYATLRMVEPEAFSRVNLQVYYLGCLQHKSSALCTYLASVDLWWAANVFGAIRAQSLVFPRLRPSHPRDISSTLGQQLEAYIIGARTSFNLPVFECECHQVDANKPASISIPFALYGHVGKFADARLFHDYHSFHDSFLMSDVTAAKAFSSKPVTFAMEYTSASVDGTSQGVHRLAARSWSSLSFQLIPLPAHLQGDDSPPVMFSQRVKPWLEVIAVENNKKNKKRPTNVKHALHVVSLSLEAPPGETFHVVLDSVPYGPFAKVVMRPSSVCSEISVQLVAPQ